MKACRRPGFTLVELLASMALTTLLMLAIFQVLASVGRQGRALAERERSSMEPWQADLINTFRWDLANARSVPREGPRLILRGHGSLDATTLSPRHGPAGVSYFIRRISGRNWLVRRETPLGGATWTALVCPDVTQFELRALDDLPSSSSGGLDEARGVSTRYAIHVECADGKAFGETIVLR